MITYERKKKKCDNCAYTVDSYKAEIYCIHKPHCKVSILFGAES